MRAHTTRSRIGGFTLVELLVVVAIVAIGAVVAMPSLTGTLRIQRVRAAATDLTSSLLVARSEAIKRRDQVRIAPQAGSDWTTGWRVVAVTAGDQLERKNAPGEGVQVTRAPASVVYDRNGRLTTPGLLRLEIADAGHQGVRCVTIDPAGLPRQSLGACP